MGFYCSIENKLITLKPVTIFLVFNKLITKFIHDWEVQFPWVKFLHFSSNLSQKLKKSGLIFVGFILAYPLPYTKIVNIKPMRTQKAMYWVFMYDKSMPKQLFS